MRWPWVSRALYERVCEDLREKERTDAAVARAIDAETAYRRLVDKMLDMKRETLALPPAPAPPSQPLADTKQPPAILLDAARDVSPVPDRTYEYNMALIWRHRDRWDDETQVALLADRIRKGAVQ